MMTDCFTEYLVKKVPSSQDNMKKFFIVLGTIVLSFFTAFLAVWTNWYLILIVTMGIIYGAYYLLTGMSVEYEYTFTNGELDVDKILGKRKRIHLISVDAGKFEAFGELTDDVEDRSHATLVLCADNTGEGEYYADVETEEFGSVRIVFTPNDTLIHYIEEALPYVLKYQRKRDIGV